MDAGCVTIVLVSPKLGDKEHNFILSKNAFLDKIKLCSLSPNLGDTRTIVTHPASTTHSKLSVEERLAVSITDGLVRVSVGLETVADVIADLEQALS